MTGTTQWVRIRILGVSLLLLVITNFIVSSTLLPSPGTSSLWFYSAAVALLLADLVVEPWYTRPADAVANATAVLLASIASTHEGLDVSTSAFDLGRAVCCGYAVVVIALGLAAMRTKRAKPQPQARTHEVLFTLASSLGRAKVIFSMFFAVTSAAAFADSADSLLLLYVFGGLVLWTDTVARLVQRISKADDGADLESELVVDEIAQPRTAFVRASEGSRLAVGTFINQRSKRVGVVVDVTETTTEPMAQVSLLPKTRLEVGESLEWGPNDQRDETVIASVGKGTSLDRAIVRGSGARFDEVQLTEGDLLTANIRDVDVLYQVVDATIEAAVPEHNPTSKRVQVTARKLGSWDENAGRFATADWIPAPGQPAHLVSGRRSRDIDPQYLGRVPGTDYGTAYDPKTGATHNTAILGILGVGKTTLATEMTWRTLEIGAKVIVIDITNEYARHFEGLFGPDEQTSMEKSINDEIAARRHNKDYDEDHGGNRTLFRNAIRSKIDSFLNGDESLIIINPARLIVTQDDGGYTDTKGNTRRVVSLNPAEVTAIVAQVILGHVSESISDELRVCLVLEEAHTLAPEWGSVVNENEKQAAVATARALMQGRKFGFGSIVVTQRTANVTKSILNQCNTIIAMRTYDKTGTEFLGNFIGDDYSKLLANLQDRHAIVFGKASSCASPLLVELNDKDSLEDWREEIRGGLSSTQAGDDGVAEDSDPSVDDSWKGGA